VSVVIVGAGPAGASVAIALARSGVPSIVLDDNPHAGGQIFRSRDNGQAPLIGHDRRGDTLREALRHHASLIDHRRGHEVIAAYPGPKLWVAAPEGRAYELAASPLVLATGAIEISVPVPGWTLPGVYTLGGLQILAKASATVPAGRIVLAGAGPLLYLVAAQLVSAGVNVTDVVDAAGFPTAGQLTGLARVPALLLRGIGFEWTLRRHGVAIHRRSAVVEIVGEGTVREVVVAPVDDDWAPRSEGRRRLPADVVGLSFGLRPNTELTQLAGCEHVHDSGAGGWRVKRDAGFATSVADVYAVGDGAGIGGVDTALAEGTILGHALARRFGTTTTPVLDAEASEARRQIPRLTAFRRALVDWSGLRPGIFRAADAGTMVCRCEDVRAGDIDEALAAGIALPRGLKLRTRAGMGLCQGRTCAPAVQHRIADKASLPLAELPMPTVRVPLRPVPVAALATLVPGATANP
jgi:NADPH-dependent 2,4-dienoyl-CoA reductase/sulfur reductase-like enzyme